MREAFVRRQIDDLVADHAIDAAGDLRQPFFELRTQLTGRLRTEHRRTRRLGAEGRRTEHDDTEHDDTEQPGAHVVILIATAVMSSFGGVSPRNDHTAEKIASTTARAVFSWFAWTTVRSRSVPNSRPRPSVASVTPSVQNT